jgi:hypothetical protein
VRQDLKATQIDGTGQSAPLIEYLLGDGWVGRDGVDGHRRPLQDRFGVAHPGAGGQSVDPGSLDCRLESKVEVFQRLAERQGVERGGAGGCFGPANGAKKAPTRSAGPASFRARGLRKPTVRATPPSRGPHGIAQGKAAKARAGPFHAGRGLLGSGAVF